MVLSAIREVQSTDQDRSRSGATSDGGGLDILSEEVI